VVKILIVYATTEGQTQIIAERVAAQMRESGHDPELYDAARRPGDLDISAFDKIIVAGSVHQRRHQRQLEIFVLSNVAQLKTKQTLFLSVSLSAAFDDGKAEAQGYVDEFFAYTGWQASQALPVAGALRYDEYDFFMEQIVEHVVLKDREVTGPPGDHEFTDWAALFRSVEAFLQA
jgi:menaquinone-dependent protoporphyrinogen oxidase